MALAYRRALGPGVRRVVGDDELVEIAIDGRVGLLRAERGRAIAVLHQQAPDTRALLDEADRLMWLDGRAGAPEVLAAGRADGGDEAVVIRLGADAATVEGGHPLGPAHLATQLGRMLRELHGLDVERCPFEAGLPVLRAALEQRLALGELTPAAKGPYAGREIEELVDLVDELTADLGPVDPVMIHGGLRASRVWYDATGSLTLTGWRRGGRGDGHLDLAGAAAMLADLYGPAVVPALFDAYGIDGVDLRRLDAHQLLVHLLS